jgi:hypothetical protein
MMGYPRRAVSAAGQAGTSGGYATVAPILQQQCANCHNPNGGAPFNLLSYEDAKQWSGQILDVTQSRYMPPWLPAPGKGEFVGERRLSDAELAAIRAWVGAGAPPDAAAAPVTPTVQKGWFLGAPDVVLVPETTVNVPVSGPDLFITLVVPVRAKSAGRLRAIEIRPSDPQAVRSVLVSFDEAGRAEQSPDWKQGIAGMEPPQVSGSGSGSGAGLVFWAPWAKPLQPRAGEVWAVTPKTDLLLTTHLKTTGKKIALQLQIGLYYERGNRADGVGTAAVVRLEHRGALEIPAGASATTVEDSVTVPQAMNVTAIYPRAHFLAHSFDAYATAPGGKQVWLLSIPKWDVDWLEVYRYKRPVVLPRGSVIHWKVTYDNSAENPHNPSDPPATVRGGSDARDEADALMLEAEPAAGVNAALWRKSMDAQNMAGKR